MADDLRWSSNDNIAWKWWWKWFSIMISDDVYWLQWLLSDWSVFATAEIGINSEGEEEGIGCWRCLKMIQCLHGFYVIPDDDIYWWDWLFMMIENEQLLAWIACDVDNDICWWYWLMGLIADDTWTVLFHAAWDSFRWASIAVAIRSVLLGFVINAIPSHELRAISTGFAAWTRGCPSTPGRV